jgi:hypothetical protein
MLYSACTRILLLIIGTTATAIVLVVKIGIRLLLPILLILLNILVISSLVRISTSACSCNSCPLRRLAATAAV